jgi:hypothetical protein
MDGQGVVFGYFFGPVVDNPSECVAADFLTAGDAVLVGRFGDLGLMRAEWPIIGRVTNWSREMWPMPPFQSAGDTEDEATLTDFSDALDVTAVRKVSQRRAGAEGALPDRVMGYGFVEIQLTRLLSRGRGGR